jgi:hypothetical protein
MSFWKKIGFVENNEDEDLVEQKPNKKSSTITTAPVIQTNFTGTLTSGEDAEIYKNILAEALAHRNEPGPDFYEFYKTLQSVETQAVPEQQKYIMAFTGLSTMGLTKEITVKTSYNYLKEVDKQYQEFLDVMKKWEKTEILDKQATSDQLSQENIKLQQTIQDNMNKISELNIAVAQNTQKLATKTQQFNAVITFEKNRIMDIVNKIKTYL